MDLLMMIPLSTALLLALFNTSRLQDRTLPMQSPPSVNTCISRLFVKRILRYIKGTLHYGLSFSPSSSSTILAYSDADWAGCPDTRRSISGYAIYLGDNLVSWRSKKQPTVSRSSCESEYRALASTASEVKWLCHLLRDLKVTISTTPIILCDNQSAIFLTANPVSHNRSKHIELDYHFVRELVSSKQLRLQYVPTTQQVADVFTKSLGLPAFTLLRSKLSVRDFQPLGLRGVLELMTEDLPNLQPLNKR